jgi:tetratricopeptide (TPR) repeat protein
MSAFDFKNPYTKLFNSIPWLVGAGLLLMFFILKMGTSIPEQSIAKKVLKSETEKTSEMLAAGDKTTLVYHLKVGKELFNAGQYPDARINFSRALEIDPNEKTAFAYLAKIKAHEDMVRLAQEERNRDEAAKEREISQLLLWVDELHSRGEDKTAQIIIRGMSGSDDRIEKRARIIEAAIIEKDKEHRRKLQAMGMLRRSIQQWYITAKKKYEAGQYTDSLYYLNKVVATKKDMSEVKRAKRLIPIIRKIISGQLEPMLAEANRAYVQKKYKEALILYQNIRKASPENKIAKKRIRFLKNLLLQMVRGHYEKGEVYDGLSMFEKAQKEYKTAIQLTPDKTNEYYEKAIRKIRSEVVRKNN